MKRIAPWHRMLWWRLGYAILYPINWWLKRRYFGTVNGIHDRQLWKAIEEHPEIMFGLPAAK